MPDSVDVDSLAVFTGPPEKSILAILLRSVIDMEGEPLRVRVDASSETSLVIVESC